MATSSTKLKNPPILKLNNIYIDYYILAKLANFNVKCGN